MFTKLLKALLCKYFRRDWTFFFAFRIAGETIRLPQRFADRAVDLPSALDERRDRGDLPKRKTFGRTGPLRSQNVDNPSPLQEKSRAQPINHNPLYFR
ncbi:hypothetical protein VTN31DRAFT_6759 [Thermomyces dupontii]|uniref:uncharacterized protein n=1 Tax=Talaromyces thermophilus TaxID=28565 RepID=UPI0037436FA3